MIDGTVDTGLIKGGAKVYTYGFNEVQIRAASIGIAAINNYLNTVGGGRASRRVGANLPLST